MFGVPISIVIAFCFFYLFAHYQSIYLDNFQFTGAGPKIYITVSIYRIISIIFGLIFLILLGRKIIWFAPIILLVIGVAIGFFLDVVFRFDKLKTYFCGIGFLLIPLLVIFMLYKIISI